MHLSGLFVYPVKSLRGCAVPQAEVDALGLVGDRRFLVVDPADGRFLTQRTHPRMATIATALTATTLALSAEGLGAVSLPRQPDPSAPLRPVSIWKNSGLLAEDCGDDAARWLAAALLTPVRLVRLGPRFLRPVLKPTALACDHVAFADAFPFLALSEASLQDLNDRLVATHTEPVPLARFRPNLVLTGTAPFAEDTWPHVQIGPIRFRAGGPCARCIMTTTDQETGARLGPEPLRTLATYRRDAADPTDVNFGQNLIHETKAGVLRVGDPVRPL
jgi:hypothetical protein